MRYRQTEAGYVEINTPDIMDRGLYRNPATEKFGICLRPKPMKIAYSP